MDKSIGILDKDYTLWVKELVKRYRGSQIKAAIKVNRELLRYYWELGKDIEEKQADNKYGTKFYATLSRDLRHEMPDVEGLSETSIRYAKRFYTLYNQQIVNLPQVVEESGRANLPQLVERLYADLFSIPWGHHRYIIDKCSNDSEKALFYVRQTLENGWSRDVLLNVLSTHLYERSGKALTNFKSTLPDADSDLAQELTRDPYDFSFTGLRGKYHERNQTGDIVRFRNVVDAGDENARFSALDDYGTDSAKCHVKQLATGLPLEPHVCDYDLNMTKTYM